MPRLPADQPPPGEIRGEIEFRNLTFAYSPTTPPVLHNINSARSRGQQPGHRRTDRLRQNYACQFDSTAVRGRTWNAADRRTVPSWIILWRRCARCRLRAQETFLFSETIRENVAFGAPDASDETNLEAARAAHIRDEILEFPKGFGTMVGERGVTLSGGQKQRTAIARAIVRDPRILILDDALSSVDTYTEERILNELAEVMRGRTTIFISHRVSTVRNADQIAVLVNGTIVELGTHDELVARNGYYTQLHEKQMLEEELAVVG